MVNLNLLSQLLNGKKTMSNAKVTPKFKTVVIDNTVFVDENTFKAAGLQDQVNFITEKTKEGLTISISQFPSVSLWNTQQLVDSYIKQPLLTLGALRTSLPEGKDLEEQLVALEGNLELFANSLTILRNSLKNKYIFAEVPNNFSFSESFIVLKNRIRRTSDAVYFLSHNDIKALMNIAMKHWSKGSDETLDLGRRNLQQHGTWYSITVSPTQVAIGCQRVQRYELEAIAIKLGFTGQPFEGVKDLVRR